MVQLLGNELKVLRRRVRDLEDGSANVTHNKALQDENARLRQELMSWQSQRDDEDALHGKLKQALKTCHDLENENQQLKNDLQSLRLQHENPATSDRSTTYSRILTTNMDSDPTAGPSHLDFDLARFLENPTRTADYVDPPDKLFQCDGNAFKDLLQSGADVWLHHDRHVLWSKAGFGNLVFISMEYSFNSKNSSLKRIKQAQMVGEAKGLFRRNPASKVFYYGTYRCTQITQVTLASVKAVDHILAKDLMNRVLGDRNLLPPFVITLMQDLYNIGVLRFHCAILECIGFDHNLHAQLVEHRPFAGSSSRPSHWQDPRGSRRRSESINSNRSNKRKRVS